MKKETKRSWLTALCALATLVSGYLLSCANGDMSLTLDQAQATTTETSEGKVAILAPAAAGEITLYKNGSSQGSKASIAAALAAIPETGTDEYVITLARGTYNEDGLTYKGSNSVRIKGLGSRPYGTDVLIYGQGTDMKTESTRSTLSFQGAAQVVLENLTVQNSYGMTTGTAQAEALGIGPTAFSGTLAAHNCAFLSGQDTICTEGKAWFYQCYVEGDVDFLWMESRSGIVALYEECVLHAIGSRTSSAYFTAPRLAVSNTVGKGLVIWNSTLKVDNGLTAYLGRNPWDAETDKAKGTNYFKDYYEQVAVINTALEGTLAGGWKSEAHGTDDQAFVGFKTDAAFAAYKSTDSAVLTDAQVAAEYATRTLILNRVYNIAEKDFENDGEAKQWDVSSLAEEWSAASGGTLPEVTFDAKKAKVVWDLASAWTNDENKSAVEGASNPTGHLAGSIEGYDESDYTVKMHINAASGKFAYDSKNGSRTQINANTVITVPVTDGAIVSVTKTSGTFGIKGTATETYTHSGSATGVAIYCTANGYLTEVTVSKLDLTALSADLRGATATGEVQAIVLGDSEKSIMQGERIFAHRHHLCELRRNCRGDHLDFKCYRRCNRR